MDAKILSNTQSGRVLSCCAVLAIFLIASATDASAQDRTHYTAFDYDSQTYYEAEPPSTTGAPGKNASSVVSHAFMSPLVSTTATKQIKVAVEVTDPTVELVHLDAFDSPQGNYGRFVVGANTVARLTLTDDGQGGDEMADDGVYTSPEFWFSRDYLDCQPGVGNAPYLPANTIVLERSGGVEEVLTEELFIPFRCLDAADSRTNPVEQISQNLFLSGNVINYVETPEYPDHPVQFQDIAREVIDHFGDNFDYILSEDVYIAEANIWGRYTGVQNDVRGLGQNLYDASSSYGSNGELEGRLHFYRGRLWGGLINHELLHRYGSYFSQSLYLSSGGHWGLVERPGSGFGVWGAFSDFQDLGQNRYQVTYPSAENRFVYNDFELYMMGLYSSDEVEWPLRALVNPQFVSASGATVEISADAMLEWTLDDIENVEGPRIPSFQSEEKEFNIAYVVVSGRPLSAHEMSYFGAKITEYVDPQSSFIHSFTPATDGRGRLHWNINPTGISSNTQSELPKEVKLEQNYPNPFSGSTTFVFKVPRQQHVRLSVYDILGREMAVLVDRSMEAGHHSVLWDAGDLPSDLYLSRLETQNGVQTRKVVKLR